GGDVRRAAAELDDVEAGDLAEDAELRLRRLPHPPRRLRVPRRERLAVGVLDVRLRPDVAIARRVLSGHIRKFGCVPVRLQTVACLRPQSATYLLVRGLPASFARSVFARPCTNELADAAARPAHRGTTTQSRAQPTRASRSRARGCSASRA